MKTEQRTLSTICSALEYLIDRGEIEHISSTVDRVRYGPDQPLDKLDLVVNGRIIRLYATDIGPHIHELNEEWYCEGCKTWFDDATNFPANVDASTITTEELTAILNRQENNG